MTTRTMSESTLNRIRGHVALATNKAERIMERSVPDAFTAARAQVIIEELKAALALLPAPVTTESLMPKEGTEVQLKVIERLKSLNETSGGIYGGLNHPDRCQCQGNEDTPHRHYDDYPPFKCARCLECKGYVPEIRSE